METKTGVRQRSLMTYAGAFHVKSRLSKVNRPLVENIKTNDRRGPGLSLFPLETFCT